MTDREQDREAFEKWMREETQLKSPLWCARNDDGSYQAPIVQHEWSIWQAATSAAAERIAQLTRERDEARRDAERYRWLRSRVTFYNVDADYQVEGHNIPVLAQVSERIWYHATDDITHCTLDEMIDAAAVTEGGQ